MAAKLVHQYTARATVLDLPQGGVVVELAKEFDEPRPGFEDRLQELLRTIVSQVEWTPGRTLGEYAEQLFNLGQQLGHGAVWARVIRNNTEVTVYLREP